MNHELPMFKLVTFSLVKHLIFLSSGYLDIVIVIRIAFFIINFFSNTAMYETVKVENYTPWYRSTFTIMLVKN